MSPFSKVFSAVKKARSRPKKSKTLFLKFVKSSADRALSAEQAVRRTNKEHGASFKVPCSLLYSALCIMPFSSINLLVFENSSYFASSLISKEVSFACV